MAGKTVSPFNSVLLILRIRDRSTGRTESFVFLRPTIGRVYIQQTVKGLATMDERSGYNIVVRMGRLHCPHSRFPLRVTIAKMVGSVRQPRTIGD